MDEQERERLIYRSLWAAMNATEDREMMRILGQLDREVEPWTPGERYKIRKGRRYASRGRIGNMGFGHVLRFDESVFGKDRGLLHPRNPFLAEIRPEFQNQEDYEARMREIQERA